MPRGCSTARRSHTNWFRTGWTKSTSPRRTSPNEDIATVFKTLVLKGDRTGYFVCVVPGDHEVDLKAAAKISANKKADLIPMKELLPVTGYIRGGCSPIGMKKAFPTYIHATAAGLPFIYVSAGVRGLQLKVAPSDLAACVRATFAEISRKG